MAVFNTQQAPDIFDTRQLDIYTTYAWQDAPYYPKYFKVKTSTTRHNDSIRFSGLGTVRFKAEGGPIFFDIPVQGARRRTVHQTYALGYRVTMEALADAQFDVLDAQPQDLGRSMREHREVLAAGLLDDSFDGNIHTGLDGLPLISTAHTFLKHPLGAAQTASNELSPGIPLSVEGLEAARVNLMLTESEEGRQMGAMLWKGGYVTHHPALINVAETILVTEKRPGGDANDMNPVATSRSGLEPLTLPHLADPDSWWVHAKPSMMGDNQYPLRWNERMADKWIPPHTDPHTQDRMYAVMARHSLEVVAWRGFVGSQV